MPLPRPAIASIRALLSAPAIAACLCCLSFAGLARADETELLSLRQFDADDGLPQMTVLAIARDRAGYLYVGTQDGLARYDGKSFRAIALRPGMHDIVSELLADDTGGLWVGTDEHGLFYRDDQGVATSFVQTDGTLMPAIEALAPGRDGRALWVGTPVGLFQCQNQRCSRVPGTDDLPVSKLLEGQGPAGPCLWVGTNTRGVLRFDHVADGRLQRSAQVLDKEHGLPNSVIRGLAEFGPADGQGRRPLWIGTGRGVARQVGDTLTAYAPAQGYPVGGAMALTTAHGANGQDFLYVASYGGGLVRFSADGAFTVFGLANGLPETFLYSLLALDTGPGQASQLWIGTSSAGLLRQEPGRWHSLDERHVLPSRSVVSVGELSWPDGGYRVWAGTLAGAVVQDGQGQWRYLLPKAWWTRVVYDAVRDPRGRLWVGTLAGLLLIEGEHVREFTADANGLPGVSVQQLLWRGGPDGELWIGTGHGLARWHAGRLETLSPIPRFANLHVNAMLDLADRGAGEVAIASGDGLFFTDGVHVREAPPACLPHREVLDLARVGRDTLWAATRLGAVRVVLDGASLHCHVLRLPGDGPKTVYALALDRQGRLYLFGYDGTRRIDNPDAVTEANPALRITHYGVEDGLPSLEFNRAALVDRNGRLWAANNAGLSIYDPDGEPPVAPPAPLSLQASVGGHRLQAGDSLPADHEELRFEYRLLSFHAEHRIRYRSRLFGLDRASSDWTAVAERPYNRLPPGRYVFQVEARDAFGQIVRAQDLAFAVGYPWWRHPATLGLGVVLLLLAGLLLGRWRARNLAARARLLEQQVAQRTEALAAANRQLEQASHTDPMTGARNRRHFYAAIAGLAAEHAPQGGLWLLLVDIDHFKQINDRQGHAAGDDVLIEIARRLGAGLGAGGMVVRWGGEEFLLVCAADSAAAALCTRVMASVSGAPVVSEEQAIAVTCSIGITQVEPPATGVLEHIDAIVARADAAMYRAKAEGRHRAVLAAWEGKTRQLAFTTLAIGTGAANPSTPS